MKIIIFLFILVNIIHSQAEDPIINELDLIYSSLEYNTIAYNDIKEKWVITDPTLVRDVFNRFVVKNSFTINGSKTTRTELIDKSKWLEDKEVVILLRKRFYDNEIEYLAFLPYSELGKESPNYIVDPIEGGYFIRDIISYGLYEKLKDQSYYYSDLTKESFYNREGYYFDVYLNILCPRLMIWSNTSKAENKYLFSIIGKWGEDDLLLPAWYFGKYVVGAEVKYFDAISNDPNDFTYKVSAGLNLNTNDPFVKENGISSIISDNEMLYLNLEGQLFKSISSSLKDIFVRFNSGIGISESTKLDNLENYLNKDTLMSIRNYFVAELEFRRLFNVGGFGYFNSSVNFSIHDQYFKKVDVNNSLIRNINLIPMKPKEQFQSIIGGEVGITNISGLFNYDLKFIYKYNLNKQYSYAGINLAFMISDAIGFDIRFYNVFDKNKLPFWREESYFAFSPVIRINY